MDEHKIRPLEIFSQLYIGDYFADTLELSASEHGVLRLLLMRLWLTGAGLGPDEDLARVTGAPLRASKALQTTLGPLLDVAASRIDACKQTLATFDGKRLPAQYWRIVRAVVLERDGHACSYCGSEVQLHVDHRLSLSKGGSNMFENLITSCSPCNLSKGPKTLQEWGGVCSDIVPSAPKVWENARPYTRQPTPRPEEIMAVKSAGVLLYRTRLGQLEVFLVHMGGPFWAKKDGLAWSIPKGVVGKDEDPLAAAKREFLEETGFKIDGDLKSLGTFRQNASKELVVWASEGDCDPQALKSTTFSMVWPPKSGRLREFPEVDRGGWFARQDALEKIVKGQRKVLEYFFGKTESSGP